MFNKFFLKDSFKVGSLFKLLKEKSGFITLYRCSSQSYGTNGMPLARIHSFVSSCPTSPELNGRKGSKKTLQAGLVMPRAGSQFYILQSELTSSLQASLETSTAKPTSRTKAGSICCTNRISVCMTLRTAVGKWHVPTWQCHFGCYLSQPH